MEETREQEQSEEADVEQGWMTAEKVAALNGLVPGAEKYQQRMQACISELESRPHRNAALAFMGEREFYYEHETLRSKSSNKRKFSMIGCAEVDEKSYKVGVKRLADASEKEKTGSSSSSAGSGKQAPVPLEAWEKAWKELENRSSSLDVSVAKKMGEARVFQSRLEKVCASGAHESLAKEYLKSLSEKTAVLEGDHKTFLNRRAEIEKPRTADQYEAVKGDYEMNLKQMEYSKECFVKFFKVLQVFVNTVAS